MKKISYFILIFTLMLLYSCNGDDSNTKLTLDDYKIYKSQIKDSDWYKNLLHKNGNKDIEFRKMNDDELEGTITMDGQSNLDSNMEKYYIFSPNQEFALDSHSYGLETNENTGEEYREVDTSLLIHDIKNEKNASLFVIGPSGSIDLVKWIDNNSFITVTSDHETEQKVNFTILVYKIQNNTISKVSGFYGEAFL